MNTTTNKPPNRQAIMQNIEAQRSKRRQSKADEYHAALASVYRQPDSEQAAATLAEIADKWNIEPQRIESDLQTLEQLQRLRERAGSFTEAKRAAFTAARKASAAIVSWDKHIAKIGLAAQDRLADIYQPLQRMVDDATDAERKLKAAAEEPRFAELAAAALGNLDPTPGPEDERDAAAVKEAENIIKELAGVAASDLIDRVNADAAEPADNDDDEPQQPDVEQQTKVEDNATHQVSI